MTPAPLITQLLKDGFFKIYLHVGSTRASQTPLVVKNPYASAGRYKRRVRSLDQEDPLEEGTAIHSSILARRIPWTEEPGRLQSIGSHRVEHNWSDLADMCTDSVTDTLEHLRGLILLCGYCFVFFFNRKQMCFCEGVRDTEHLSWSYDTLGTLCSVFCIENNKFQLFLAVGLIVSSAAVQ